MFTFLFTVYVVKCWIGLVCDAISNVGLEMGFAVAFHHMGRFERNRGLKYVGGEIHVVSGIDPDFWSFFEALGIVKEFKYAGDVRLWWKGLKETLLNNLRLLSDDKEALALAKYAEDRNEEVDIYVQHIPCQPEVVHFITGPGMDEEVGQEEVGVEAQRCETEIGVDGGPVGETDIGIEGDEEVQVEKKVEAQRCETDIGVEGDQEVHVQQEEVEVEQGVEQEDGEPEQRVEAQQGVEAEQEVEIPQVGGDEDVVVEDVSDKDEGSAADKLDESEEERVADDDDGFGMHTESEVRKIGPVLDRWRAMKRNPSTVRSKKDVGPGSFVTNEEVGQHDISDEYDTDELDSDVDSEDGVRRDGPKFSRYRAEDMTKDFKFNTG